MTIFSGLPNPVWTLPSDVADRTQRQILSYQPLPAVAPPAVAPPAVAPPAGAKPAFDRAATDVLMRPPAGFRGFTLTFTGDDAVPERYHTFGALILEDKSHVLRQGESTFGEQLYNTAPDVVKARLGGLTYAQLIFNGSESPIAGLEGTDPRRDCTSATVYEGNTGDWKTLMADNNCYNYATYKLNETGGLPAAPGPGSQLSFMHPLTPEALMAGLHTDRLEKIEGNRLPTVCPGEDAHYIVVTIRHHPNAPDLVRDYHCVRLDRGGTWSHKDGPDPVRDHDDVGKRMMDLTQAQFKWTPKLVGIYRAFYRKRNLID